MINMLCYLIYVKNMKIHFKTSYLPNSKSNLHRTHKFYRTYELQYTHCFFQAKTVITTTLCSIANGESLKVSYIHP